MKNISIVKSPLYGFLFTTFPGFSVKYIKDVLNENNKVIKTIINFILFVMGVLLSLFLINIISVKLNNYFIFIVLGLVCGYLLSIKKEATKSIKENKSYILFIISIIIVIILNMILKQMNAYYFFQITFVFIIYIISLIVLKIDSLSALIALGLYSHLIAIMPFSGIKIINIIIMLIASIFIFLCSKVFNESYIKEEKSKVINFGIVISAILIIMFEVLTGGIVAKKEIGKKIFKIILAFAVSLCISLVFNVLSKPTDQIYRTRQKKSMLRFFFVLITYFPYAFYKVKKMRRIIKENKLSRDEQYAFIIDLIKKINFLGRIHPQIYGTENITDDTTLFIVNHQGRYDGLAVYLPLENHRSILLADESKIVTPLYTEMFIMTDGIKLDKSTMRTQMLGIREMTNRIEKGESIIAFIEGDYGDNKNELQEFHTGVLHPAYKTHVKIVPVVLYDSWKVFGYNSLRKIYPEVHFLNPIYYEEYAELDKNELSLKIKERMQEKLDEIKLRKNKE